jgi:hypothetical protein
MRFKVPYVDLRKRGGGNGVLDDTGKIVGLLFYGPRSRRDISLLGKYHGSFKTDQECDAFAQGVAAVLNHMVAGPSPEDYAEGLSGKPAPTAEK